MDFFPNFRNGNWSFFHQKEEDSPQMYAPIVDKTTINVGSRELLTRYDRSAIEGCN